MNHEAFRSKRLVAAALDGKITPRVPTGPLAVHFGAGLAGFTLRQYTTDPRALAESVIRSYERLKPDAVWLSGDATPILLKGFFRNGVPVGEERCLDGEPVLKIPWGPVFADMAVRAPIGIVAESLFGNPTESPREGTRPTDNSRNCPRP